MRTSLLEETSRREEDRELLEALRNSMCQILPQTKESTCKVQELTKSVDWLLWKMRVSSQKKRMGNTSGEFCSLVNAGKYLLLLLIICAIAHVSV